VLGGIIQIMNNTSYHKILRVAALTLAVVLLFDSGLLSQSTSEISQNTQQYLATAIGMQAGVVPTELNQVTAQLTAREQELAQRESELAAREIKVNLENGQTGVDRSTYILSTILFVILVLLVLNYVLDYLRIRERKTIPSNEQMA